MLSNSELRRLRWLERELELDAPRLATRLRTFGRAWLLLRLVGAALANLVGIGFLCSGAGWGCAMFGLATIAVSGWKFSGRLGQLWPSAEETQRTSDRR